MGPSSLVVSLPSKWVKQIGVKAGDEIHVEELTNGLHLSVNGSKKTKDATVDVSNSGVMIHRILCSLYKAQNSINKIYPSIQWPILH